MPIVGCPLHDDMPTGDAIKDGVWTAQGAQAVEDVRFEMSNRSRLFDAGIGEVSAGARDALARDPHAYALPLHPPFRRRPCRHV
jgi:hypothetical protein